MDLTRIHERPSEDWTPQDVAHLIQLVVLQFSRYDPSFSGMTVTQEEVQEVLNRIVGRAVEKKILSEKSSAVVTEMDYEGQGTIDILINLSPARLNHVDVEFTIHNEISDDPETKTPRDRGDKR